MSSKRYHSSELIDMYSSSEGEFENGNGEKKEKPSNLNGAGYFSSSDDVNYICSDSTFHIDNTTKNGMLLHKHQEERRVKLFSPNGNFGNLYYHAGSPTFQSCQKEIPGMVIFKSEDLQLIEPQEQESDKLPLASLSLLMNYQSRFRLLEGERIKVSNYASTCSNNNGCRVSTDAIIRLAGESFIKSSIQKCDYLSDNSNPCSSKVLGLSAEDVKDVELVKNLLSSVEKVGQKMFQHAMKLLNKCSKLSSNKGNPVERLVYYFSVALTEKINYQIGMDTSKSLEKKPYSLDFEEVVMSPNSANIAYHKEIPFSQVSQFTGVQAIIEHVAEAKKVHIIDFVIMNGSNCIVLMQALAAREEQPLEHLRVTAIGTKSPEKIEETGKRLMSFAESINLPFSFNVIVVTDMLDLNEDLFELNAEEVVAVHSSYLFSTMIAMSDQLECILRVIRNINPSVMVIIENEGNTNSPVFVNRFIEALFYYGALFDCLEDCMERSNPNRFLHELIYYSPAIQNIVVAEGKERTTRHVNISVWRAFFGRFAMTELDLSKSSLYQARLVADKFACGSSCTLDKDGKSLIIGWKGTPVLSLSCWRCD